jgi:hypothetical protein
VAAGWEERIVKRAAIERAATLRRWRYHIQIVHGGQPGPCPCEQQPNRFRKSERRGGCGRPRCHLCKAPKLLGAATRAEQKSDFALREWLAELDRPPLRNPRRGRRLPSFEGWGAARSSGVERP